MTSTKVIDENCDRVLAALYEHDPRKVRLSEHFVLSDFLGNQSVYAKGYENEFLAVCGEQELGNGVALCNVLEHLLLHYGPISISYGAIAPTLSDKIVKYQDPRMPSHHLWSLGAACDFISHRWIAGGFPLIEDAWLPESAIGSPIALAHAIEYMEVPYSRLITYSESPYLCLAVSFDEVTKGKPRRAFYENRYEGKKKAKPSYNQYASDRAKMDAFSRLQDEGLPIPWEGHGYPTYHGGGFKQFHHERVSKYTMVSDWLFDLKSISEGAKNIPQLNSECVQDAFAAAGIVYDWIIDTLQIPRASIVAGYVSPTNPNFDPHNDWREDIISFTLALPKSIDAKDSARVLNKEWKFQNFGADKVDGFLEVAFSVSAVLEVE